MLEGRNGLHCPCYKTFEDAARTFNYQIHGERILTLDLPDDFLCDEPLCKSCVKCCLSRKD